MKNSLLFSLLISFSLSGALLAMESNENSNNNETELSDLDALKGVFKESDVNNDNFSDEGIDTFLEHFKLDKATYRTLITDRPRITRLEIMPSKPGIPYISSFYPSQRKLGDVASTLDQLEDNDIANILYSPSWESPPPEEDSPKYFWPAMKRCFNYSLKIDKKHS